MCVSLCVSVFISRIRRRNPSHQNNWRHRQVHKTVQEFRVCEETGQGDSDKGIERLLDQALQQETSRKEVP